MRHEVDVRTPDFATVIRSSIALRYCAWRWAEPESGKSVLWMTTMSGFQVEISCCIRRIQGKFCG
ncbi:MAG: hypothetical protein R2716_01255 [Microthrixaceae bacterium]